jgi:hypothetical protein
MAVTDAEAPYLGLDHEQLAAVADQLAELGYSPILAQGVVGWLVMKTAGRRDVTATNTRTKYRKVLRDHAERVGPPPGRRIRPPTAIAEAARRSTGQRGSIRPRALLPGTAVAFGATAAHAAARWLPIMTTTPGSERRGVVIPLPVADSSRRIAA